MTRVFITTHGGGHIGNEIAPITNEEVLLPIGVLSVQKSEDDLQHYDEIPILMPGPYNTTVNIKSDGI